jgi:hypothetical protein
MLVYLPRAKALGYNSTNLSPLWGCRAAGSGLPSGGKLPHSMWLFSCTIGQGIFPAF